MGRDYEAEGKELLFRALEAMVKNIENCGGETFCSFNSTDLEAVYKLLVSDSEKSSESAERAVRDGISDALLKAIENA